MSREIGSLRSEILLIFIFYNLIYLFIILLNLKLGCIFFIIINFNFILKKKKI